ncbi:hypothetical protein ADK38_13325, partial [Streptomyces varsoviensis]
MEAPGGGRERKTPTPDGYPGPDPADDETESAHRRAAAAGDTAAMSVLGAMLLRRGDLDGAERQL